MNGPLEKAAGRGGKLYRAEKNMKTGDSTQRGQHPQAVDGKESKQDNLKGMNQAVYLFKENEEHHCKL